MLKTKKIDHKHFNLKNNSYICTMKKILTLLAFSLIVLNLSAKETEPKLILEYNYGCTCDTMRVVALKDDPNFCCYYEIQAKPNSASEDICYIRDKETGVLLGTIYGKPTKEFLLYIYNTQLKNGFSRKDMLKLAELQKEYNCNGYSLGN